MADFSRHFPFEDTQWPRRPIPARHPLMVGSGDLQPSHFDTLEVQLSEILHNAAVGSAIEARQFGIAETIARSSIS